MRFLKIFLIITSLPLLFASFSYGAAIKGLVLYLPFNEGKGDVAQDLSGNNNNGVLKGQPEWVKGKDGFALKFNGEQNKNYVEVADHPSLNPKTEITCAAWIYFDKFIGSGGIISKYIGAGNQRSYTIHTHHDNALAMASDCSADGTYSAGVTAVSVASESVMKERKWHHIAMTFVAKDSIKFYIDGVKSGEAKTDFMANLFDNTVPLLVGNDFQIGGAHRAGQPREFTGIVDEVAIFNRALSDAEIQKVMNGQILAVESNGKIAISWGAIKGL